MSMQTEFVLIISFPSYRCSFGEVLFYNNFATIDFL